MTANASSLPATRKENFGYCFVLFFTFFQQHTWEQLLSMLTYELTTYISHVYVDQRKRKMNKCSFIS